MERRDITPVSGPERANISFALMKTLLRNGADTRRCTITYLFRHMISAEVDGCGVFAFADTLLEVDVFSRAGAMGPLTDAD